MSSTLVIHQPQPVMISPDSEEWSSGIFDCCQDVPQCCFACWCLSCFACITSRKHGQCLCLPLLDIGIIPPITLAMRVSVRERYGIKDSICRDCVFATFCCCCTWCQISREMKKRDIPVLLFGSRTT